MGLGGITISNKFGDVSYEAMNESLQILKMRYLKGNYPNYDERISRLKKLVELVKDNSELLTTAIEKDFGTRHKQISLIADINSTMQFANHAIKNLSKWIKPSKKSPNFPLNLIGAKASVEYQPFGVVGIISPWNFPVNLSIGPLVDIFAAGNGAMIKLSEFVPNTSELLAELISNKFSVDEVIVVNGNMQTSVDFTKLEFDHLIYTGSSDIAKKVSAAAATNLVPLTLELGGKSPVVVGENTNIDKIVSRVMFGKLFNSGQICVSPDYLLMPDKKVDSFVEGAKNFIQEKFPTIKNNPDYTSLIHRSHFERVQSYIDDARQKGAKIIEVNPANEDLSQQEHNKIPPTIILNPTEDMEIMKNEIFGPVLPIKTYFSFAESISYINNKSKPLALYYFGDDKNEIENLKNSTSSGSFVVNDTIFQTAQYNIPFGGVGTSGSGSYRGHPGFLNFSHKRSIYHGSKLLDVTKMIFAPYTDKTLKMIDRLTK